AGDSIQRFISNSARRTRHFHQEPSHFHYPGLPEVEFHDRADFPELAALEAQTAAIREEFDALIASEAAEMVPYIQYPDQVPLRQWQALNKSRDWSAIHLIQNGETIEANARHCPSTMRILKSLPQPQIPGASPNAMFSLLAPRTRIPPHTGVANIRLVCHLPLIVPPNCGFRVGATTLQWREGEAFVFDDTVEHEAWNDSDQLRVVMICDLWVPALSKIERTAIAAVIPAAGVGFTGAL
ncbi:MAG: aspartyl/asparaginyl beta-hydroxylase domain-containing protein, partial [Gammaproteobacteria bacterium]